MNNEEEVKKIPLVSFGDIEEEPEEDEKTEYNSVTPAEVQVQRRTNINVMKKVPLITFDDDPGRTKTFLVLLSGNDEEGNEFTDWNFCNGRAEAYSYIKSYIEYIDLYESYIIGNDNEVKDAIRVIDYLNHVLETGKIEDPGFDPMDYVVGDYIEEEEDYNG